MRGSEVAAFFRGREDVHSYRVGITRNILVSDGIVAPPVVLERIAEELAQIVQVVPNGYIFDLVRSSSPSAAISDISCRDRAHGRTAKVNAE